MTRVMNEHVETSDTVGVGREVFPRYFVSDENARQTSHPRFCVTCELWRA